MHVLLLLLIHYPLPPLILLGWILFVPLLWKYLRSILSYPADCGCPQDNGNDDVLIVVRIGSVFRDGLFWSATQKAPKRKMSNNKLFVFIIEFFWFPALLGSLFFPSPRLSLDRVTEPPPPPDNRSTASLSQGSFSVFFLLLPIVSFLPRPFD